jgi:hypothetical protein
MVPEARARHWAAFAIVIFVAFAGLLITTVYLEKQFEEQQYIRALQICDRTNVTIRQPLEEAIGALSVDPKIDPGVKEVLNETRSSLIPQPCTAIVPDPGD